MPKPINKTIGKCECSRKGCTHTADVRKDRQGKFYLVCPTHQTVWMKDDEGQEFILNNATLYGAEPTPEEPEPEPTAPEPKPEPGPEPEPEPAPEYQPAPEPTDPDPEPAKKKSGVFGWLNDFDL